jgi:hypothetical protein
MLNRSGVPMTWQWTVLDRRCSELEVGAAP